MYRSAEVMVKRVFVAHVIHLWNTEKRQLQGNYCYWAPTFCSVSSGLSLIFMWLRRHFHYIYAAFFSAVHNFMDRLVSWVKYFICLSQSKGELVWKHDKILPGHTGLCNRDRAEDLYMRTLSCRVPVLVPTLCHIQGLSSLQIPQTLWNALFSLCGLPSTSSIFIKSK